MTAQLQPLIVTLAFDEVGQAAFEGLRRRHFPPRRNVIPAHLTLFHHLPGEKEGEIAEALAAGGSRTAPMRLEVTGLRFLGRGVAYEVAGLALFRLRAELAALWSDRLTPQDRQGFRPHVTIQNKADPATAKALFESLSADFRPYAVNGRGLRLWRYLGGPWEERSFFPFEGGGAD